MHKLAKHWTMKDLPGLTKLPAAPAQHCPTIFASNSAKGIAAKLSQAKCLPQATPSALPMPGSHVPEAGDANAWCEEDEEARLLWLFHQDFQVPKMEVLNLIRRLFRGWGFPYIVENLHFRYLKSSVIVSVFIATTHILGLTHAAKKWWTCFKTLKLRHRLYLVWIQS